jgi:hypothetical protein
LQVQKQECQNQVDSSIDDDYIFLFDFQLFHMNFAL